MRMVKRVGRWREKEWAREAAILFLRACVCGHFWLVLTNSEACYRVIFNFIKDKIPNLLNDHLNQAADIVSFFFFYENYETIEEE